MNVPPSDAIPLTVIWLYWLVAVPPICSMMVPELSSVKLPVMLRTAPAATVIVPPFVQLLDNVSLPLLILSEPLFVKFPLLNPSVMVPAMARAPGLLIVSDPAPDGLAAASQLQRA